MPLGEKGKTSANKAAGGTPGAEKISTTAIDVLQTGGVSPGRFFQTGFGIDAALIDKILNIALAKGGDYADFFADYEIGNSLRLEDRIIKTAAKSITAGVGIRVLKGDQTGYAYVEDITYENLKTAAETAASIAAGPRKTGTVRVTSQKATDYYPMEICLQEVDLKEKIRMLREAEEKAFGTDPRIVKVTVTYADSRRYILLGNSDQRLWADFRPMMRFSAGAIGEENRQIQTGNQSGGGRIGMEYFTRIKSPGRIGEEAAEDAVTLLSAKDAPAGPMPLVLAGGDSGILLHEAIGHPLEADFNRKGTSAYAGRIGQKVASEHCTIYDGGVIPHDRGSINFDDEGALSQKTLLIERGILRGYMHDRISADFYRVKPTGNGRRESYKYHPLPRMTVTFLENGSIPAEEIIRSVRKGIFCRSFSGGQVDIANGDFVFNPTVAYLIEDGRITTPVKNFTLIGNGPDVLTKVTMVGDDFAFSDGKWTCGKGQSVPVGVGLPTVLISEITVGGKQG